ncbi:MAG: hypothetical protein RL220_2025 [Bacteroidota bacterium]|jgi:large subunit ribosomal protein L13
MDTLSYKTISANKETAKKEWVLVDAAGQPLGRMASQIASILRGKTKPSFTPHADCGDNVVVINASKVILTGTKMDDKEYVRYTNYPGGQRFTVARDMQANFPERMIEKAVKGMLPKNRLGRAIFRNLYVYAGTEHEQTAQQPKEYKLSN